MSSICWSDASASSNRTIWKEWNAAFSLSAWTTAALDSQYTHHHTQPPLPIPPHPPPLPSHNTCRTLPPTPPQTHTVHTITQPPPPPPTHSAHIPVFGWFQHLQVPIINIKSDATTSLSPPPPSIQLPPSHTQLHRNDTPAPLHFRPL
jgi:hypothetical protein